VAGVGIAGFAGDSGPATNAQFNFPEGLAVDGSGNLYISDTNNARIRKVGPDGIVTTVAGTGSPGFGGDGGPATSAQLNLPFGIAMDSVGNLLIADLNNGRIRKVDASGVISTIAGSAIRGFAGDGGPATSAQIVSPFRVAVDESGNILIADGSNNRIRKVSTAGLITTAAGNGTAGFSGDGGRAGNAQFNAPYGMVFDPAGNLLVADSNNNRLRKISPDGGINTLSGTGAAGANGDGGPAGGAQLRTPFDVTSDQNGNIYIADANNQKVRRISAAGVISTYAGRGAFGFSGDGGAAASAQLATPIAVAIDAAGNLFISDNGNNRIRKVAPTGTISTVAGSGTPGFSGDDGPAVSAQVRSPNGLAVDPVGNLYIADTGNHVVRKVSPTGVISTVAGTGSAGFSGDGGLATAAQLNSPYGVAVDSAGTLFVTDSNNNRVRRVNALGQIITIAGTGSGGFRGDGGDSTFAWLSNPRRIATDARGNVFVADTSNHRIRELIPVRQSFSVFTIPDRGATSLQTFGTTAGPTSVGYAQVVPDPGVQAPAGLAIFGFRQNNVLVSETGVPATATMMAGRVFAEVNGTVHTGIAIANPNDQAAAISFFFTGPNGDFGRGSATIPPKSQLARFLDQAPFNGPSPTTGTFTLQSNVPVSMIALRSFLNERDEFLLTTLPVVDTTTALSSSPVVFPHFATGGGWSTQLVLVNPSDTSLEGTVEFRNPAGDVATISGPLNNGIPYSIPPRSFFKLQMPNAPATVTGSVHVIPVPNTPAPSGLGIFSFQNRGVTVTQAGVPAQPAGSAFRLYTESVGDFSSGMAGSTRTGLAVANNSTRPTTVIVEVENLDGTPGLVGTINVPPNGQTSLFLNEIHGLESLRTPFQGILRLTSFAPVTIIGLRARYNERNDLLITTTPPANESIVPPSTGIFFPHFADAGGYTTQFILFGTAPGQPTSGIVRFFSQSGGTMNLLLR